MTGCGKKIVASQPLSGWILMEAIPLPPSIIPVVTYGIDAVPII